MKTFLALALCCASLATLHASTTPLAEEAQAAWQNREAPGMTEQAISLWQENLKTSPTDLPTMLALTKACGRAVRHAKTSADRKRWSDLGRQYGEKIVLENPQSSMAFAFYGEALGQWARNHKGFSSPKAVKQAMIALRKSVELDPRNAYAHMLLSQFYLHTPAFLGGDKARALEEGKLAVQFGPDYAINHLAFARALLEHHREAEAVVELQAIGALAAPKDAIPETHADQETAADMLKALGVSPTPTPTCGETGGVCSEQTK